MWNEEHAFDISSEKEALFEVLDKENVGEDKFMGELKANILFGRVKSLFVDPNTLIALEEEQRSDV